MSDDATCGSRFGTCDALADRGRWSPYASVALGYRVF
jgi:hypothetical protein